MRTLAVFLAAALLGGAVAFSCGTVKPGCSAASCQGCCDGTVCQMGTMAALCGSGGALCQRCSGAELCLIGQCTLVSGAGGGSNSLGGGTTATGGGTTATGGGIAGTGGGSTASCTNCQGCCDNGTCVTATSPSQCGANGVACKGCATNELCSAGVCSKCSGCFDLATGACSPGTSSSSCGKGGAFCSSCGSAACDNQACACTPASCPKGCCAGNSCIDATNYTDTQCGTGAGGAQCVSCSASGHACSKSEGSCVDAGVGDGGLVFPDGGLGLCFFVCPGKCCEINVILPVCAAPGAACTNGIVDAGVCDPTTLTCK